jgi:hypothetical protein
MNLIISDIWHSKIHNNKNRKSKLKCHHNIGSLNFKVRSKDESSKWYRSKTKGLSLHSDSVAEPHRALGGLAPFPPKAQGFLKKKIKILPLKILFFQICPPIFFFFIPAPQSWKAGSTPAYT